jgi:hypothetical protein
MSDYTPTTEQVRTKFATVLDEQQGWRYSDEWAGDFDRWLTTHTAEIRKANAGLETDLREAEEDLAGYKAKLDNHRGVIDRLSAQETAVRLDLQAAVCAVEMHQPESDSLCGERCAECEQQWPCRTIQAARSDLGEAL